ncbi:MAG: ATP-binding protein [Actinomycetota bacterium]|nr:ATP-binding protein [Actinomycetota bacterium]
MGHNPFHYGTPVQGDQFTGREQELAALIARMRDGINVVLLSPRRYGKTSLLLRAEAEMSRSRPAAAVVKANVLRARDLAALAGQLTAGVYRLPGARWHRTRQALPEFLRRMKLRPTVTINDHGQPVFGFDSALAGPDADTVLADLYALLEEQSESRPAVLILDEFQAIVDLGAHLPSLLKSLADSHPAVSLVMAGSKRHLMERLVNADGAPLYGLAQRLALGPIPDQVMAGFLCARAAAGGKPMPEATAVAAVSLAGPVPNDIQRLAYEAFEVADTTVDDVALASGLDQAVAHEAATYAELFAQRSGGQRRVLAALAMGGAEHVFSSAFARSVGLAGGNSVKKVLDTLGDDELAAERDGRWQVTDPFFAAWLRLDPV